jgi:hypothetical protein
MQARVWKVHSVVTAQYGERLCGGIHMMEKFPCKQMYAKCTLWTMPGSPGLDPQLLYDYRCRVLNMVKAHYGERLIVVCCFGSSCCSRGSMRVCMQRLHIPAAQCDVDLFADASVCMQAPSLVKACHGQRLIVCCYASVCMPGGQCA